MSIGSQLAGPRGRARQARLAAMAAALLIYMAAGPASAQDGGTSVSGTRVLEAADHAELSAGIAGSEVVRIALLGDRIARAVRGAGRFGIEHDPATGDLYLRPLDAGGGGPNRAAKAGAAPEVAPAVLFLGTEKGFTYRLTLVPVAGGPAQILIRNPAAGAAAAGETSAGYDRIGALVRLVRAAARREPLSGHAVHAGGSFSGTSVWGTSVSGTSVSGLAVIETWRGPRFSALVFEAGPLASEGAEGAADLAGTIGGLPGVGRTGDTRAGDGARLAALWLAAPGTGPSGGRLAVAVFEDTRAGDAPAGDPRHAGDTRAGDIR